MTPAEIRRLIALNGYAAWSNCLVGNPAPVILEEFRRSSNPVPGDLVLEKSTYFRWARDPEGDPGAALGYLLRVERGEIFNEGGAPLTDEERAVWIESDGAVPLETHWVVRPFMGQVAEYRWFNCDFIRVHTRHHRDHIDGNVITRDILLNDLNGTGFDLL